MSGIDKNHLILALYPSTRGFAFVLYEGPESPFDWGVREIKEKHRNLLTIQAIKELIDQYRPEALVIEDITGLRYRRSERIRKLYRMITHLAASEYVDLERISERHLQNYFSLAGAITKYERAQAIALQIPAFGHRVPRPRKAWEAQDPRMSLFDAAALGLVYYGLQGIASPYHQPSEEA